MKAIINENIQRSLGCRLIIDSLQWFEVCLICYIQYSYLAFLCTHIFIKSFSLIYHSKTHNSKKNSLKRPNKKGRISKHILSVIYRKKIMLIRLIHRIHSFYTSGESIYYLFSRSHNILRHITNHVRVLCSAVLIIVMYFGKYVPNLKYIFYVNSI